MKGTECIKESIGDLLDLGIEYFVQVSFSTFVDMIDSLGGVEVDVPLDFCMDQDSNRNVAQPYCLVKGEDTLLYGEWALALARNRKYDGIYNGDYGRIRNQALIVNGIMERLSEYPMLLLMAEYGWRANTLAYHNFNLELKDLEALFYLAEMFSAGYTVDNYFIENVGDMTESGMSIGRLTERTKEIAKLKIQYALTGEMDKESKYYEEAMLGYVTGGAGNYTDKYIGEEYYLEGYEAEVEETDEPVSSETNE
jgi:LCP family protein required for cell wall assembly